MKTKKLAVAILTVAMVLFLFQFPPKASSTQNGNRWAVIVCCDWAVQPDSDYMYDVLDWYQYNILFLSVNTSNPHVDDEANRDNLQYALDDWLSQSTENDLIFIYITSHGGGYRRNTPEWPPDEGMPTFIEDGGRAEIDSDEGFEFTETHIQEDVNGDGEISDTTWVGADECLFFTDEIGSVTGTVWDDELDEWLNGISYHRLIALISACHAPTNATQPSCFSGGFIDDLSGPKRIIITSSNETYWSWYEPETNQSFFDREFISALDPCSSAHDEACGDDGAVSIYEAYSYALNHDMARKEVRTQGGTIPDPFIEKYKQIYAEVMDESPWLDDNGNGLPTFKDGADHLDENDGDLAKRTYLVEPVCAMKTGTNGYFYVPDVAPNFLKIELLFDDSGIVGDQAQGTSPYGSIENYPDGIVDGNDVGLVSAMFGLAEGEAGWDYMGDVSADRVIDGSDLILVSRNYGNSGAYITDLSEVTVTFSTGDETPDDYGFVMIPYGAANFTVKQNSNLIGAVITFWENEP